jgi:hypothetical protein
MRLKNFLINDQGVVTGSPTLTTNIAKFTPYNKKKKTLIRRKKNMDENEKQKLYEANKEIAKTILTQIHTLDKWAFGAWGAREFITLSNPPGLQFRVNGAKFQGKVIITLNGKDLYDIQFGLSVKATFIIKHKEHDIYAEDLVRIIDEYVEK